MWVAISFGGIGSLQFGHSVGIVSSSLSFLVFDLFRFYYYYPGIYPILLPFASAPLILYWMITYFAKYVCCLRSLPKGRLSFQIFQSFQQHPSWQFKIVNHIFLFLFKSFNLLFQILNLLLLTLYQPQHFICVKSIYFHSTTYLTWLSNTETLPRGIAIIPSIRLHYELLIIVNLNGTLKLNLITVNVWRTSHQSTHWGSD